MSQKKRETERGREQETGIWSERVQRAGMTIRGREEERTSLALGIEDNIIPKGTESPDFTSTLHFFYLLILSYIIIYNVI